MKRPISVSLVSDAPAAVVSTFFAGFEPQCGFTVFQNSRQPSKHVLHGESDAVIFDGVDADPESDYYLAVCDEASELAELYEVPVVRTRAHSRKKARYTGPSVRLKDTLRLAQRNALGQEFGTRKAKKSINSVSQNRIEADKLASSEDQIVDSVEAATADLPTLSEVQSGVDAARPTPVANVQATNVEDVYTIESVIPRKEWSAIRVDLLKDSAIEFFPYKASRFIKERVEGKEVLTERMKLLYYALLLMGVYHNRRVKDKQSLTEKLNNPSEVLVDGVVARFTSLKAGAFGKSKDRSFKIDPFHEDKLLCHLLVLVLHIEGFTVLVPPLAQELGMKPSRLTGLFRALGCGVKGATLGEADRFKVPRASAASYKVARLRVPFKEPLMVRRR